MLAFIHSWGVDEKGRENKKYYPESSEVYLVSSLKQPPIYGGDRVTINRTKIRVFPSFVGLSTDFPKLSTGIVIFNNYSFFIYCLYMGRLTGV
jgi:hypothetical protein